MRVAGLPCRPTASVRLSRPAALARMLLTVCSAVPLVSRPGAQAPLCSVDLTTRAGVASVQGVWRYHDARVVAVPFHAAGADRKPSGPENVTGDIEPKAGAADFDDAAWEHVDPETLHRRRGSGKTCFGWYRFTFAVPDQLGGAAVRGTTIAFEVVVDDYCEVWVDGALPRRIGQAGGNLVAGWNTPNRLVVVRDAVPGQTVHLALFAANGPLSDPPSNYLWVRRAHLDFVRRDAEPAPGIERLDPRLDAVLAPDAVVETLATGFAWVEGPTWDPARGVLLFSDIPENRIWQWKEQEGERIFVQPSGDFGAEPSGGREPGSNGLALDGEGRLIVCQHGARRLARWQPDGTWAVLADRYGGRRLNSPNDVVVARDGSLYFTDPPYGLPGQFDDPGRELGFSGVYRLPPDGKLTLLVDDLAGANGIALSPDEGTLYVSNAQAERPLLLAYALGDDGTLGSQRVVFDFAPWMGKRRGGPDGIAVASDGTLFAVGPGGVYVLTASGEHLGTILTGGATSNCRFGEGGRSLFITAGGSVLRVRITDRCLTRIW